MKKFRIDHRKAWKIMWVFCGASFPFLLLGVIGSQTMILTALGADSSSHWGGSHSGRRRYRAVVLALPSLWNASA